MCILSAEARYRKYESEIVVQLLHRVTTLGEEEGSAESWDLMSAECLHGPVELSAIGRHRSRNSPIELRAYVYTWNVNPNLVRTVLA